MTVTGTGIAVGLGGGLLLAGGLAGGFPTLAGLGVAGLVLFAVAVVLVLTPATLAVTRVAEPLRVTVGDTVSATVDVRNAGRLPTGRFEAIDTLDGEQLRVAVPPLAPGASVSLPYPVATNRRGVFRLGPVRLERTDPLGLVKRGEPLAGPLWIWVYPQLHPLRPLPIGLVVDFEGDLVDRAQRGSTAFSSLREYQAGDDFRHIHWRSTARLGALVVQDRVDTTEPTVTVVLDTRTGALAPAAFEEAVGFAASVVVATDRAGQQVALVAGVGASHKRGSMTAVMRPDLPPSSTHVEEEPDADEDTPVARSVLDRLAAVRASADAPDPLVAARSAPAGGVLVLVTGTGSGVVPRLQAERRRYSRIVVVQFDADAVGTTGRNSVAIITAQTARQAAQAYTRLATGAR